MQPKLISHAASKQIFAPLLFVLLLAVVQPTDAEESGTIVVRILRLKSSRGFVRFGLFDSKESFPKQNQVIRKGEHPINGKQCEFVISGLPFGDYAVAVGHDENGNSKIDRFLGFPLEPVGISGYSKRLWAVPSYAKANFSLTEQTIVIEIPIF